MATSHPTPLRASIRASMCATRIQARPQMMHQTVVKSLRSIPPVMVPWAQDHRPKAQQPLGSQRRAESR